MVSKSKKSDGDSQKKEGYSTTNMSDSDKCGEVESNEKKPINENQVNESSQGFSTSTMSIFSTSKYDAKYPLVSRIKEMSPLIKIEKLEEEDHCLFPSLTIEFSIEFPEKKEESNSEQYQHDYRLTSEMKEKIISYVNITDIYILLEVGLWKESVKNVVKRNWKVKQGYDKNDYNIEDNDFPSIFGMGLPIFRKIWIELGQEEIEEKLEAGLEGPFPKIPPPVLVNCSNANDEVGYLSYQSSLILDEEEDDLLLLKYLKNATNRIQKLFS